MPIKPSNKPAPGGAGHIVAPKEPPDNEPVYLSFKLLDIHSNQKFTLKHCGTGYWEKLLLRLQELNRLRVKDFRVYQKEWRNHEIRFTQTSEPKGFTQLPMQLRSKEAWQFELTKGQHGRVHGLLIDNIFFVVWIDPCHQLYGNQKCGH